mgnify:CR=1 FL=1
MRKRIRKTVAYSIILAMMIAMSGCGKSDIDPDMQVKQAAATEDKEVDQAKPISLIVKMADGRRELIVGDTKNITVDTAYTGDITYRSMDESIITVDDTGMVTAVAPGEAKVEITAGKTTKWIHLEVKEPVVEAEEETSTEETAEEKNDTSTATTGSTVTVAGQTNTERNNSSSNSGSTKGTTSGTTGAASGSGTTTSNRGNSSGTANSGSGNGGSNQSTAAPATEATTAFNPSDYYLDWGYIQDQVNKRLQDNYPECKIGQGNCWAKGDYMDGVDWLSWTNESMINNLYEGIADTPGHSDYIGLFIDNIEVHPDGSRTIYFTGYY